jgi:hypothetical protein
MSSLNEYRNLFQELERVESILASLFNKISNVNDFLKPIEHSLRAEEFSSRGSYVPGTSNGIVCVLSALIKGDPLSNSIESIRGKGHKLPAIIKGSDRSETKNTYDSILKIVEGKPGGAPINFVINLRWANLPSWIDGSNVLVIGTRFQYCQKDKLNQLYNRFRDADFQILEDRGEFGGGPLTYKLTELARKLGNITVLEITLSRHFAESHKMVSEILESLTIL